MTTQEMVTIVDRFNEEIGTSPRPEMRARNLIHRASFILVFNDRGELFVQQRTMTKDIYPGCWEIAAGGVVTAGETVSQSAERELREELAWSDPRYKSLNQQRPLCSYWPGYLLTECLVLHYWLIYCDEPGWFQRTAPNFGAGKKAITSQQLNLN